MHDHAYLVFVHVVPSEEAWLSSLLVASSSFKNESRPNFLCPLKRRERAAAWNTGVLTLPVTGCVTETQVIPPPLPCALLTALGSQVGNLILSLDNALNCFLRLLNPFPQTLKKIKNKHTNSQLHFWEATPSNRTPWIPCDCIHTYTWGKKSTDQWKNSWTIA